MNAGGSALQVSSLTQTSLSAKVINEDDDKERPVTYTRCSGAAVSPASPSTAATPKPSGVQPSRTNSTGVSDTALTTQQVGTMQCSGDLINDFQKTNTTLQLAFEKTNKEIFRLPQSAQLIDQLIFHQFNDVIKMRSIAWQNAASGQELKPVYITVLGIQNLKPQPSPINRNELRELGKTRCAVSKN